MASLPNCPATQEPRRGGIDRRLRRAADDGHQNDVDALNGDLGERRQAARHGESPESQRSRSGRRLSLAAVGAGGGAAGGGTSGGGADGRPVSGMARTAGAGCGGTTAKRCHGGHVGQRPQRREQRGASGDRGHGDARPAAGPSGRSGPPRLSGPWRGSRGWRPERVEQRGERQREREGPQRPRHLRGPRPRVAELAVHQQLGQRRGEQRRGLTAAVTDTTATGRVAARMTAGMRWCCPRERSRAMK